MVSKFTDGHRLVHHPIPRTINYMNSYVALLRGIAPMNPNMQNAKLRSVFEGLGFANVRTVISSGNVLFESPEHDTAALERQLEVEFPRRLGFESTTIIRSRQQLQRLLDSDPFHGAEHSHQYYLTVTFTKTNHHRDWQFPYQPTGKAYQILGLDPGAIYSRTDLTAAKTPDLMTWLEREFGKDITTRTYQTVKRIVTKLPD